jgi:C-terminal processing protease CtpA/Prc
VLVNPLDFSCADLLPAILQDNGRAKLFGQRTSGAGGAVKSVTFPNQFGIAELAYTWTIAVRESGKPIENLGVEPDYPYAPTPEDFQSSFSGYKRAVNEALKDMLKAPAPGAL